MGLDTDGQWPATINVARKNYALLTDKGKVNLQVTPLNLKNFKLMLPSFWIQVLVCCWTVKVRSFWILITIM